MNWFSNSNYQFLEISEDCKLRLFDIRSDIKVTNEIYLGKDFPTNFDIDDTCEYIKFSKKILYDKNNIKYSKFYLQ